MVFLEEKNSNLSYFIKSNLNLNLNEEHLIIILFNLVNNMKLIHSANIVLRDIRPENILINENCEVKFTNLDMSRTLPECCIAKGSGNTKRVRNSIFSQNLME